MRTRTRDLSGGYYNEYRLDDGRVISDTRRNIKQEKLTDLKPGPGMCNHVKPLTLNGTYSINPSISWWDSFSELPMDLDDFGISTEKISAGLNWSKLPTSSGFGLIQILAELDDTVAIFAKRFWQSLSYGSFTWGIIPLISDLKALVKTISDIQADLSNIPYEDEVRGTEKFDIGVNFSYYNFLFEVAYDYRIRFSGSVDISFQHPGSLFLDRLGFHPDIATFWDIIPFSFVVDYLLPIGDYLDTFRQGGWVKCAIFNGWSSYKIVPTSIVRKIRTGPLANHRQPLLSKAGGIYSRSNSTQILSVQTEKPEFEAPSFREMFNILYLVTRPKF